MVAESGLKFSGAFAAPGQLGLCGKKGSGCPHNSGDYIACYGGEEIRKVMCDLAGMDILPMASCSGPNIPKPLDVA